VTREVPVEVPVDRVVVKEVAVPVEVTRSPLAPAFWRPRIPTSMAIALLFFARSACACAGWLAALVAVLAQARCGGWWYLLSFEQSGKQWEWM
jgi:hypothetical protein